MKKNVLLIYVLALCCFWQMGFSKDYRISEKKWPYKIKLYAATITQTGAPLLIKDDVGSKTLGKFKAGDQISVLSRTPSGFYKAVLFSPKKNKFASAFIEQRFVEVQSNRAQQTPSSSALSKPLRPAKVERKSSSHQSTYLNAAGLDYAYVKSAFKYGANHHQFGGLYERTLFPRFSLGVPVAYGFGDVFKVYQLGVFAKWDVVEWEKYHIKLFASLGGMGQILTGNGKSFKAVSVHVDSGIDVPLIQSIILRLAPLSVDTMVIRSEVIPMNVRLSPYLGVYYQW